ncbi:hypothetical protein FD04_GL001345 [Secundilactobacillus odoratitofui DSM 19909 = JCM 15043]|uniref:Uncharacterized protein n=1 Tax=Secundilactobacillus odoratitofui DSM 19909 = JCM 15043 TaxID=1423776 RepID=A0A0R1LWI6_9LACO|nr:type I-E CRISPR-associated protein Cse1/CasA [Secundilactobacillus odoratitofui]KRK97329.1 hypothetical protein FD04_GL001345 [Secundilactobacillus odoratitofui DSM 19909 = JCM 15043]
MVQQFNLVTDPWIKVLELETGEEQTVSLTTLFEHAQQYRQLAGEMKTQDLVIMRLLLAVLHTVYSRFDANNEPYSWLELDSDSMQVKAAVDDFAYQPDDLLDTWDDLYQSGKFSDVVVQYLKLYQSKFDFFGGTPFYQVTADEYDQLVPAKKKIATGTGTVSVKQINRQVSESGNTPAIFSPKVAEFKDQITIPELVRWLISYQNFTGVTDKTKIEMEEKFSNPAGWLYRLNPVFAKGQTLFDTLMLNLVLVQTDGDQIYQNQKPVWEYDTVIKYVEERKLAQAPTNLAFLYTAWSRVIHIEWQEDQPTIFSAGLPMFSSINCFLEPMTVWKIDKSDKHATVENFKPAVKGLRSLGIAMWRNFGSYVKTSEEDSQFKPGLVKWLNTLDDADIIPDAQQINLVSTALISDGNATSQAPVAEVVDDMSVSAGILFDDSDDFWPGRIMGLIDRTQKVGSDYWRFVAKIGQIRNIDSKAFANTESAKFYDRLNQPFKAWLQSLTDQDDRDKKSEEWQQALRKIVNEQTDAFMKEASPRDIKGITIVDKNDNRKLENIFTAKNQLNYWVSQDLELGKR